MRILILIFFINLSIVAKATEKLILSTVDDIRISEPDVIDYVSGSNIISIKKENDEIIISAIAHSGKTYIILFKKNGEQKNFFIEISNNYARSSLNSKKEKLISGNIKFLSKYISKNYSNPYSIGLNTKLKTSENSLFNFNVEHFYNSNRYETNITSWEFDYKDYFLNWSEFTEPIASVPFYLSNKFRGYTLAKKNNDINIGIWEGNKSFNREEDVSLKGRGFFFKKYYNDVFYNFTLNNRLETYIPTLSTSFNYKETSHSVGYSSFSDKNMFSYSGSSFFNKNSDNFNFKNLSYSYSSALKGAYGLSNSNDNYYQNYGVDIFFANEEKKDNLEKEIDFISGNVSSSISYNKNIFNNNEGNRYHIFFGYGKLDKLTLSGSTDFSKNDNNGLHSEILTYSPRLSFFFKGDKKDGYSIRNEYIASLNKDYLNNVSEKNRNTIGLYRNTKKYYLGFYLGSNIFESNLSNYSSKILGSEVSYNVRDNLTFSINGENVSSDKNYENSAGLQLKTIYKKDLSLFAKLLYSEKNDSITNQKQSSLIGNIGLSWYFGAGEGNIYSNIESSNKYIQGYVFNDSNLNGVRDDEELYIKDIDVSIIKTGNNISRTKENGEFNFSGFSSQESVSLNINDIKYAQGKNILLNMKNSQKIDIPLYEYEKKKIYIKNDKGDSLFNIQIKFSCEKNITLKKELFSDHILYYMPKNKRCDPEISDSTESGLLLSDTKQNQDGSLLIIINPVKKGIFFEFTNKIKNFYLNNKLIYVKEKEKYQEIDHFDGVLDIKLEKNCKIMPEDYKKTYNRLKNQNFYKIFCF